MEPGSWWRKCFSSHLKCKILVHYATLGSVKWLYKLCYAQCIKTNELGNAFITYDYEYIINRLNG